MEKEETKEQRDLSIRIFDSFDEAEACERKEWMSMPRHQRMILLEELRSQTYPDERTTPQGLQRILTIVG